MDLNTSSCKERFLFLFKIPYIKTHSVDEFFSLPKKEREWYGFYKKPLSLPLDGFFFQQAKGWNAFYEIIKKEYPIQYFFREWLFSSDNPVVFSFKRFIQWPLREAKCAIKLFLKPCYKRWRKVLPRWKYSDAQHLLVESNFAILRDFYYEEVIDGFVDWNYDEFHKTFKSKIEEYVAWIEVKRNAFEEKMNDELSKAAKNKIIVDGKFDFETTYKVYNEMEKEFKEKETEILKWMIDNREMFWS